MIHLTDIDFGYGGQTLMEGLSLHIKPLDRIGLVGPNGAGKTTLLRIIRGEITDFTGEASRRKGLAIGLLPQEGIYESGRPVFDAALETFADLMELEQEVERLNMAMATEHDPEQRDELLERAGQAQHDFETRGGFTFRARTAQVLTGLGFTESDMRRDMSTFSGGWQMRVALARLLLQEPDVLLLDEPTNHLDLPALLWFEEFLETYPGAVLIISHDRAFLDRVVHRIAEFTQHHIELYTGGYSDYEVEKQKRLEILQNRFENQEREVRQTERFIERFRYKSTKARQVQSRIKALEKMDRIELPGQERRLEFSFKVQKPSGKEVLRLANVTKAYGDKVVLRHVKLAVLRGERVGIIGANGLGKTTLMRVLAGLTEFQGERKAGHNVDIGYFSQDQYELLNPDKTVIEEAGGAGGTSIRTLLGVFLFSGPDVDKPVRVLSGGEKSRLLFARLMASPANFLLLDEPTNHLDPPSQAMLVKVLNSYNGTLCFVSHNRWFINAVANRIIEVTPNGLDEYLGNYDDYKYQKRMREAQQDQTARDADDAAPGAAAPAPAVSVRKAQRQDRARLVQDRARVLNPLKTQLAGTEARIDELEARIAAVEAELADPATYNDPDKMKTLPAELKQCNADLEQAMALWEQLHEDLAEREKEFEA